MGLNDSATINSVVAGSVGLFTDNGGTLNLTGSDTFTGTTTVTGGKLVVSGSLASTSITVTSPGALDVSVVNTSDGGAGSLRQALTETNDTSGVTPTITFNLLTSDPNYSATYGTWTLHPTSAALPTITASVTLDATTQPGYSNKPIIELDGGLDTNAGTTGLTITAANTTVKGFVINRFTGDGIDLTGSGATGDVIQDNYIGTSVTGTTAFIVPNAGEGIKISGGASNNTIGGITANSGNVISGNTGDGVEITGSGTTGNIVEGNLIGTDYTGTTAFANGGNGVFVSTASNNIIGGSTTAARNVISGNTQVGVALFNFSSSNKVEGNYIGTDYTGSVAIANNFNGVKIYNGSSNNQIGTAGADGTAADQAEHNVISGNTLDAILIDGNSTTGTTGNIVGGNLIGTNAAGNAAIANGGNGVFIRREAQGNVIGIKSSAADQGDMPNVISGNAGYGIQVDGSTTTGNVLDENLIGDNATDNGTIANSSGAVEISNSATAQVLNNNSALGTALNGSVADGGTLDIDGTNLMILGALTGSGTVTNTDTGGGTYTVSINGTGTFSGVIQNGSTDHTALTVAGGTVTLSGTNTYTGATTVTRRHPPDRSRRQHRQHLGKRQRHAHGSVRRHGRIDVRHRNRQRQHVHERRHRGGVRQHSRHRRRLVQREQHRLRDRRGAVLRSFSTWRRSAATAAPASRPEAPGKRSPAASSMA